jgi:2-oxoadipate dioxygenase/decarboxylase
MDAIPMYQQIRKNIIKQLWHAYQHRTSQMQMIEKNIKNIGVTELLFDHFAIIDLPGPHTGIPYLQQLFSAIGYQFNGSGYLASKQNDFVWMHEENCLDLIAAEVLPQVVVADFRLDELPEPVRKIILKYATQAKSAPLTSIKKLMASYDKDSVNKVVQLIAHYLSGRDWPLPTVKEFQVIQEFNELLAWVLVFGRRPNHFTLPVHLFSAFKDLSHFNQFIEHDLGFELNPDGGKIKGDAKSGIEQSSTVGMEQQVRLADGYIGMRTEFVEFVWRYPLDSSIAPEKRQWKDYFNGFIAENADHVIESLYLST